MKTHIFTIILALIFTLIACEEKDNSLKLIILHTGDEHANIKNYAKLSYLKDSLSKNCDKIILASSGDLFSGNPYVDLYKDRGFPMIDIMNNIPFDISTIGNHEFDYGLQTLKKRLEQAKWQFVSANIDFSDTPVNNIKAFRQIKLNENISLTFVGLIELNSRNIPSTAPKNVIGCKFVDGIEKAGEYTKMKTKNNILIALSHMGIEADKELAKKHKEYDLIIGGHTHIEETKSGNLNEALISSQL